MISIIVPCYNEESRIVPFIRRLLDETNSKKYEVIFVNDGSTDGTLETIESNIKNRKNARVISYGKNMGKGYAVRKGVMAARGDFVLFIDADGSIDPSEIKSMEPYMEKYDVVVGTRASKESVVTQPKKRKLIGMVFNFSVNVVFQTGIKDSLCGFKGFRRGAARDLFAGLKSNRWVFDVEVFHKIRKRKYSMFQMPIRWVHKENSKIRPLDPLKMLAQLMALRLKLLLD